MEPWKSVDRRGFSVAAHVASMGPRRWSRGRDVDGLRRAALGGPASMGPRRGSRGRGRVEDGRRTPEGFNGATAMEPWKSAPGISSSRADDASFNGATAMEPWKSARGVADVDHDGWLQWGHGDGAVEERTWIRADAAASIELQWGHGDGAVEEVVAASESTDGERKLQWGHGDGAVEERRRRGSALGGRRRFNGATAMEPWKSDSADVDRSADVAASMGPRRGSRGRALDIDGRHAIDMIASMGPRRGAVEEVRSGSTARVDSLQWGHGDGAVEEVLGGRRPSIGVSASMGPRRGSRGRGPASGSGLTRE